MKNFASRNSQTKADPNYPFHSRLNEKGEVVFSAPLEVIEDSTLDEIDPYVIVSWFGGKPMKVRFFETTDRVAAYGQVRWLNNLHKAQRKEDQEKKQKVEFERAETNHATRGGKTLKAQSNHLREEVGFIQAEYSDLPDLIAAYIRKRRPKNDLYVKVYMLNVQELEPKEISEELGIDLGMVYYYLKEALKIAQEYRRLYFDEGDYKFPETFKSKRTRRKTD